MVTSVCNFSERLLVILLTRKFWTTVTFTSTEISTSKPMKDNAMINNILSSFFSGPFFIPQR
jgi:hypothetical protein